MGNALLIHCQCRGFKVRNSTDIGLKANFETKLRRQGMIMNPVDQRPFRDHIHGYFNDWANTFGPTAWGILQNALGRKLN